jgi:hypothetical protein
MPQPRHSATPPELKRGSASSTTMSLPVAMSVAIQIFTRPTRVTSSFAGVFFWIRMTGRGYAPYGSGSLRGRLTRDMRNGNGKVVSARPAFTY